MIGQFRLSDLGNKIDAINLSLTEWFLTHQRRCIFEKKNQRSEVMNYSLTHGLAISIMIKPTSADRY